MTRDTLPPEEAAEFNLRRTRFWTHIALCFTVAGLAAQAAILVNRWTAPRPPTMHTRRVCRDDGQIGYEHDCVRIEIPDGQCAKALGVTICVPDPSSRKVSP